MPILHTYIDRFVYYIVRAKPVYDCQPCASWQTLKAFKSYANRRSGSWTFREHIWKLEKHVAMVNVRNIESGPIRAYKTTTATTTRGTNSNSSEGRQTEMPIDRHREKRKHVRVSLALFPFYFFLLLLFVSLHFACARNWICIWRWGKCGSLWWAFDCKLRRMAS